MLERTKGRATSAATGRAVLIVGHGSRNASANEDFARFAEEIAAARPEWLVEHAHMELASPDFPTSIQSLVDRGAQRIQIHLHFLSAGMHVRETIPELVAQARGRHPAIEIEIMEPLGRDPRLVEIVIARIDRP